MTARIHCTGHLGSRPGRNSLPPTSRVVLNFVFPSFANRKSPPFPLQHTSLHPRIDQREPRIWNHSNSLFSTFHKDHTTRNCCPLLPPSYGSTELINLRDAISLLLSLWRRTDLQVNSFILVSMNSSRSIGCFTRAVLFDRRVRYYQI
jgi:hypothetical protein